MISTLAVVGGLSKTGGGTSYSVPAWSNALARENVQRFLVTVQAPGEELSDFVDANLVHLDKVSAFGTNKFNVRWAPGMKNKLRFICREQNIQLIHNHGAWLPANHTASQVARDFKIPYLITPHGMLTLWCFNNKPVKKRLAWWFYQKKDVDLARVIHVTAQSEGDELRHLGYGGSLAVIPNGLNLPDWKNVPAVEREMKTALFVSRIHPKKGLLDLVAAWAKVRPKGWRMRLVGPDEGGYQAMVEKAIREKGLEKDFIFDGSVFGERLWNIYRESDLFILPTLSENFGNVVPEAMACGLPVICTHGAPWEELNSHSCGWWVPVGAESLEKAMREAFETTAAQRREMGLRGRRLVEEKYTWASTGRQMKSLYEWILGEGKKPEFVQEG